MLGSTVVVVVVVVVVVEPEDVDDDTLEEVDAVEEVSLCTVAAGRDGVVEVAGWIGQ